MRLIMLAAALAVSITGLVSGQSAKQRAAIEQQIRRLDVAHADAVLRGDLVARINSGRKISKSTIRLMKSIKLIESVPAPLPMLHFFECPSPC